MTPVWSAENTSGDGIGVVTAPMPDQMSIHSGISGIRILIPSSSGRVVKAVFEVAQRAPW